jgi:two-component system sensor histidine kinase PrrB
MKLATRTGLAALVASAVAIVLLSNAIALRFEDVLRDRVDEILAERAESAPVLVAVGDRISVSELNGVIGSARVLIDAGTDAEQLVAVGPQPPGRLAPVGQPGLRTVAVDGESWRLLAVAVDDVPAVGDRAVVEFAEPLGAVQQRIRDVRRRVIVAGLIAALGAGALGWLIGRRAARPLTSLQHDAAGIGSSDAATLAVAERYGTPEVDEIAGALNASLAGLSEASARREEALAAARDFAASATHELRTPLQSAMTNLDVALVNDPGAVPIAQARSELVRMASSLAAVQALSQADLAQPDWFETTDLSGLGDLVDEVTSGTDVELDVGSDAGQLFSIWPDGVRLAIDNVVRNALTHGRPSDRSSGDVRVGVTVAAGGVPVVVVDDDGPGIAAADRRRVLAPFERGATEVSGSGLGLAVVERVAKAHGGRVVIEPSPSGGTRVRIVLGSSS